MKKKLVILGVLILVQNSIAGEHQCEQKRNVINQEIVYEVNKDLPKHLIGATITITQANGKTSTVPAERFMVVSRKQKTVVGSNTVTIVTNDCTNDLDIKKNTVMVEGAYGIRNVTTETSFGLGTVTAKTYVEKAIVPGIDYYRRQVLDTPIGVGVGIDARGLGKAFLGLDF